MKISKTMLWTTLGTVTLGGIGLLMKTIRRYQEKVSDSQFLQQELEILEGEGGICLG